MAQFWVGPFHVGGRLVQAVFAPTFEGYYRFAYNIFAAAHLGLIWWLGHWIF